MRFRRGLKGVSEYCSGGLSGRDLDEEERRIEQK
jgi:hypothetical protein